MAARAEARTAVSGELRPIPRLPLLRRMDGQDRMERTSEANAEMPRSRHRASALLHRLSLKHKLIAVIMLTCVTSLVLGGMVFIAWEWADLRRTMLRDLGAHAEALADNCRTALAFRDAAEAGTCLRTVGAVPSIMGVCVYTRAGELFAMYVREGTIPLLPPPQAQSRDYRFDWESLVITRPVLLNGEPLGTVCLRGSLDPLYLRLRRSILVIVGTVLLSSLTAYLISARLQRLISRPILRLADAARLVSDRKAYTVRVESASHDEVGLLVQAFNEMLEQIQQRDVALVEANEQLEARVSARTTQLRNSNERLTREITARRRTDSALAEANERLADMVQSLRRSNQELQDFAYVAAHDLKAPLRGIGTLADWIASDYADKLDESGRQQIALLKRRVTRLTDLINGILHYSEVGRVTHPWEIVDLGKLVPETIALLDPPPHVQVVVRGELPAVVSEKVRLGQVFHNLINNAITYMDKPQGRIEIGCTDQGSVWQFSVADNGPGIEERHFEKIFQMFQTLAPRDQCESTGIGLPIVKKIVELFGGRIWVESRPGVGSTFFFTLPKQGLPAENVAPVAQGANLN
jgi:signal transduction histidine kinase